MELSRFSSKSVAAIGLGLAITLTNTLAQANESETRAYEVSITNITSENQFTPILAATHNRRAGMFTLGNAPRVGLAILAETGSTGTLEASLGASSNVGAVGTFLPDNGPDGPPLTFAGNTVEFTIESPANFRYFSVASMILPTNDSFVALDTVPLPSSGSVTHLALGYDAGSEHNDEICADIPGPTCGGSGEFSGFNGEGFVHISPGIHGAGDLSVAEYDWRNPVAKVVITRVR